MGAHAWALGTWRSEKTPTEVAGVKDLKAKRRAPERRVSRQGQQRSLTEVSCPNTYTYGRNRLSEEYR